MKQFHMSVGIDFLLKLEDSHLERILPALKNGQGGHPSLSELRQFLTREQALGHNSFRWLNVIILTPSTAAEGMICQTKHDILFKVGEYI